MKDWVNQSARLVARKFPWTYLEAEWTAPATSDSPNYYQWPQNLMAPLSMRIKTPAGVVGKPLVSRTVQSLDRVRPDQTTAETAPDTVTFTSKLALLTPRFASPTGYVLVLRGLQTPPEMIADTDPPIFPDTFADVLEHGATMLGADWLWHDPARTQQWERRFLAGVGELRQAEAGDLDHQDQMLLTDGMAQLIVDSGAAGGSTGED